MPEQTELFTAMEFVDPSHGMTDRSTRLKLHQHRQRKTIALLHGNDRPSIPQT